MIPIRLALWSALAGGLIPFMAVLNARLGRALGESLQAPFVLFMVAFGASAVICLSTVQSLPDLNALSRAKPIDFLGGFIVCFYVLSATLLAPRIGVGNFILFAVSAQIITAAVVDHLGLFGAAVREVSLLRLIGILVLIAGLVITQMASSASASNPGN